MDREEIERNVRTAVAILRRGRLFKRENNVKKVLKREMTEWSMLGGVNQRKI